MPPEAEPNPKEQPPDLPWYIALVRREKATMKGAPFAFTSCVLILTALLGISIFTVDQWHYGGTITAMDANIASKESTIELQDKQIIALQDRLSRLPPEPAILTNPNSARELKHDALYFCQRLNIYNMNWPVNWPDKGWRAGPMGMPIDSIGPYRSKFESDFKPELQNLLVKFKSFEIYSTNIDISFNYFVGGGYELGSNMVFNISEELTNMVKQLDTMQVIQSK